MQKVIFILFFPCALLAQTLSIQSPVRFLALGDSYTIGQNVPSAGRWPNQLMDSLAIRGVAIDTLRIIATTGWRTDDLISAITNKNLENQHYNLVAVLIGVNNQYQGSPFVQYVNEFPQILDSALRYAAGDTDHMFVMSIPDYAYTPYGVQSMNQAQISQEIDQYNSFNQHIADSMQIQYFNITPISRMGLTQPSYVAGDGLHPSAVQYTEWVKLILDYVDSMISGRNELEKIRFLKLYPNPTKNLLHIKCSNQMNSWEIFNSSGDSVLKSKCNTKTEDVPIENLSPGIYLLKVTLESDSSISKKFLVK